MSNRRLQEELYDSDNNDDTPVFDEDQERYSDFKI